MIHIIIADDQTLMRDGLKTILDLEDDLKVIGTAENGEEAYQLVRDCPPHVVLMDIQMPVMDGIESLKRIKKDFPGTNVLMLTTFAEHDYIVDSLLHGATGFLLKDMQTNKLIQSIRDAANGQFIMPSLIAAKLAERLASLSTAAVQDRDTHRLKKQGISFTERETKIIELMIEGENNREIAKALFMSEGTVKNYISMIYSKIGVNERAKAVAYLQKLVIDP